MTALSILGACLLGLTFVVAATSKIRDIAGVERSAREFGVPQRWTRPVALTLPMVELGAAGSILGIGGGVGAIPTVVLLVGFTALIATSLARDRHPECHCFGNVRTGPVGASTVVRNTALLAIAIAVSSGRRESPLEAFETRSASERTVIVTGLVLLALVAWVIRRRGGTRTLRAGTVARVETFGGTWLPGSPDAPRGLPVGASLPNIALVDLDGAVTSLSALCTPGRELVISVTHPECRTCAGELVDVANLATPTDDFDVCVISLGSFENGAPRFSSAVRLLFADPTFTHHLVLPGTPSAFVVDGSGRVASSALGGPGSFAGVVEIARARWLAAREQADEDSGGSTEADRVSGGS